MKYGEAFSKLGYKLQAPRTDWSAQGDHGVCLTLWRSEIDWAAKPLTMDTRLRGGRLEEWERKPGNIKRRMHILYALEHHAGWVDAIIVDGTSKTGVEKATPWNAEERFGLRWRITYFEADTGHFCVEALSPN
ncbi:hypothetical protein U5A82_17675 [Sphingobium sp. CR2-8]|uniref:hypothetical protein n=1 Tax=Sphingobium sp. CR2-8 TaxID=1306534 RepID=UPI002DBB4055|nr:hypothetical protein [Sphingobium sp. CR2-8]MEC3912238.1 hypothetical protein [Sphingobium sp. CR2-8]